MNEPLPRNTPLFYKKLPQTEDTPPNAYYNRFVAELPKDRAHEIIWRQEKWLVSDRDILTVHQALAKTAENWNTVIQAHKKATVEQTAKAIGVSETTLRNRMKLVQNHLPKPRSEPSNAALTPF